VALGGVTGGEGERGWFAVAGGEGEEGGGRREEGGGRGGEGEKCLRTSARYQSQEKQKRITETPASREITSCSSSSSTHTGRTPCF
jgi:hypothetical protein